jgi:hypothetical protein
MLLLFALWYKRRGESLTRPTFPILFRTLEEESIPNLSPPTKALEE